MTTTVAFLDAAPLKGDMVFHELGVFRYDLLSPVWNAAIVSGVAGPECLYQQSQTAAQVALHIVVC